MANSIKANQRKHAAKRLNQRYGIEVTARDIRAMVHQIQSGQSRPIRAISNTRTLHEVEHGVNLVWALYDKSRQNICTFYPRAKEKPGTA